MEDDKKKKIFEARARFEKSLVSPDLTSEESIRSLVGHQLLLSKFPGSHVELENVVQRRALEVSNFIEMLRSASGSSSSSKDWKLKQESDQLRVMYREGTKGTPFHTLLAEGFVDGPVDSSLCVSWESTLYKNWWPQYNIPTFKIISSCSLQKVRVGEEISLVRVKPPWPVTDREAILHNFELEFFKEEMVVVLLNTVPSNEQFNMSTHGFSKAGIPDAKDTVRIDIVGGFSIQKVSSSRSYFRAMVNMDIKLDFVPPTLINFISRQLIGNGHKLYQKAVASVVAGNEHYADALQEPMYARIRDHLYSSRKPESSAIRDEKLDESHGKEIVSDRRTKQMNGVATTSTEEIKEETRRLDPVGRADEKDVTGTELEDYISPEVSHALGILDKAITIIRDLGSSKSSSGDASKMDVRPDEAKGSQPVSDLSRGDEECAVDEKSSSALQRVPHQCKQNHGDMDNSDGPTAEQQPSVLEQTSKVFGEVGGVSNNGRTLSGGYEHKRRGLHKQHKRSNGRKKKLVSRWCVSFF